MNDKIVAFIFARSGSKGVKDKNIQLINNIPLIAYSINIAKDSNLFSDIVVSTDSQEIADIANSYGASTPFNRPAELATDESSEWLSWQHAVKSYMNITKFDYFFSLPVTSPLRSKNDILSMKDYFMDNSFDIVLGMTESHRSPYFNIVNKKDDGSVERVIDRANTISRRQDAPKTYDLTTTGYITTPDYILNNNNLFDGIVGGYEIPMNRSLDIDSEYDLMIARKILETNE